MPAPKGAGFDGWISAKAEFTGLLVKAEYGDGGGLLVSDEALEKLGYFKLTKAQRSILFPVEPKKAASKKK